MKIFFGLLLTVCCFCPHVMALGTPPTLPALTDLQGKIATELNKMDALVAQAAVQMGQTGLTGPAAAKILQKLYDDNYAAVDAVTIDLKGELLLIEPRTYKKSEGTNISDQDHFKLITKTHQPVLGGAIKMVEGFYAISLSHPVKQNEQIIGYVTVVFKPDALMGKIIKPYLTPVSEIDAMAMELDGHIIYDHDVLQIGRKTFSDPTYQTFPDLIALSKRIIAEPSGTGSYTYTTQTSPTPVKKVSQWTTISLYGTEWRLVVSNLQS